ncbi:MAG: site-specific integrase, partial [Proteobacteria bacterium]|nr:site-specific integrase [Pseudomonadota bacterium]
MNPNRKEFVAFMQCRNLSPRTRESYLRALIDISRFYNRAPHTLDERDVRKYINHLSQEKNPTFSTCNVAISAIKCYLNQFLGKENVSIDLPVRKTPKRL